MKIKTLLEYTSPSSQPNQAGGQAPKFGRDPNVLETTAGSTATGSIGADAKAMPGLQTRGGKGSMFQGISTSKKFVNSPVTEDEISEEQLLTKELRKELFKRAKDRDLGNRPEDREIMSNDPEYDDEAGMVASNLHTALRAVQGLHKVIGPNENLPEWVQEKIAIANDYLVTCWDYMISQHEQGRKYEVDEANSSNKYFMPGGGASFGRRNREDDEYHVPDPVDPNTLPYNVKVNGQIINDKPLPGRQAAIKWAKQKVDAGEIDPKATTLSPASRMSEVAPPGAKAERMVKHIKQSYANDGRLTPREKSIAYATAWKAHNKGLGEGYDPVKSDYGHWEEILEKDGYRFDSDGARALSLVAGDYRGPDGYISTIRNILTYVKQNRAVLGKAVSDYKTVKDCIMDIKNEYPRYYRAAQQPEGVAEGWDPDTTRLEQDVRDALENGDDYTAKQYAKMAPTPEAKKYLLNIIKQAMYIDDLGGETDWKGVAEGLQVNPNMPDAELIKLANLYHISGNLEYDDEGNLVNRDEIIYFLANGVEDAEYDDDQGDVEYDNDQGMAEESKGLWANIHAKRERIKHGSGERMRKPGSKGAPTKDAFRKSAK